MSHHFFKENCIVFEMYYYTHSIKISEFYHLKWLSYCGKTEIYYYKKVAKTPKISFLCLAVSSQSILHGLAEYTIQEVWSLVNHQIGTGTIGVT